MFLPPVHAETSIPVLRQLIREYPLGVLTTALRSRTHPFIQSSHIPFILDVDDDSSGTELGRLRAHMARQNPQSQAMIESLAGSEGTKVLEEEVLVLFTATPHSYVTPKFYVETKPVTGKTVPTWNYAAVQAYGRATVYYDSKSDETSAFLDTQIHDLSQHGETAMMGYTGKGDRPGPWKVSDAPEKYIELMKKNIIGIEIAIERLEGKFKMSQEKQGGDRTGVIDGFNRLQTDLGTTMARLVQERGELKDAAKQ